MRTAASIRADGERMTAERLAAEVEKCHVIGGIYDLVAYRIQADHAEKIAPAEDLRDVL